MSDNRHLKHLSNGHLRKSNNGHLRQLNKVFVIVHCVNVWKQRHANGPTLKWPDFGHRSKIEHCGFEKCIFQMCLASKI